MNEQKRLELAVRALTRQVSGLEIEAIQKEASGGLLAPSGYYRWATKKPGVIGGWVRGTAQESEVGALLDLLDHAVQMVQEQGDSDGDSLTSRARQSAFERGLNPDAFGLTAKD